LLSKEEVISLIDLFVKNGIKFFGFSTSWYSESDTEYQWLCDDFFREIISRYPKLIIVSGGHSPGVLSNFFDYINFHFQGFSDLSFVEFLKYINNQNNRFIFKKSYSLTNIVESNIHFIIEDPNNIETVFLREDEFLSHQPVPLELSRGCIFRCTFCRHPFQGKKDFDSYQRTPENIAEELKRNYDMFGTTRYSILDDTINDSLEKLNRLRKAIEIAKLPNFEFVGYIKPELLVTKPDMINILGDLGLRGAFLGIESFKNSTRRMIGKGTDIELVKEAVFKLSEVNNNRVLIQTSFIVGLPDETPEDINNTYEFLVKHHKTFCKTWRFQPLNIVNSPSSTHEKSLFDKDPKKFNYIVENGNILKWKNNFFTNKSAEELTNQIMKKSSAYSYFGGWQVAGGWHIGLTDYEIENTPYKNDFYYSYAKTRSMIEFNKLMSTYS
jgi:radical SAM superfamily enzyme YgiQ (UPF0313 family)